MATDVQVRAEVRSRRAARARTAPSRDGALDAARAVAILFVVFLHAADWLFNGSFRMEGWIQVNAALSGLRMPAFFVLSGLLGAHWRRSSWSELFSRKIVVLVWLYLLWQVIGTLVGPIASDIKDEESVPLRMLASLLLTPVRPRLELWYLWALAVSFVLVRLTARIPLPVQYAVAGAVAAFSLSDWMPTQNAAYSGLPCYYLFFLVGYHHGSAVTALVQRARRGPGLTVLLLGTFAAAATAGLTLGLDRWPGAGLVVHLLGAATVLALGGTLAGSRALTAIGERSLPIYLAHTPVVLVLVWLLKPLRDDAWMGLLSPALPLLLTAVTVPLTLLLHRVALRTRARVLYAPPPAVFARAALWTARWSVGRSPDVVDLTRTAQGPSARQGRHVARAR